jgi:hypothetical protein
LLFASLTVAAMAAPQAMGAIVGTNDSNTLAGAMSNSNETGTSLDVSPQSGVDPTPFANGVSDVPLAGFPTALGTYTILTTGDVGLADDPNGAEDSGQSQNYNSPARGDANDPTTLGVSFNVPANNDCLNFDYKFFSEEFPEFVGSSFNDRFIAELDKTTWTASGQESTAPLDFAARGTQVSINAIGPNAVSAANAAGTTYDAASAALTTKTPVTPGAHTLYLSIFDASDHIYDSAVFIDNLRFTNESKEKCQPPDIFKGAVGVDLPGSASFKNGKALIPVECKLPDQATVDCLGTLTVTAGGAAGRALTERAAISKLKKVGKKKYKVAPGKTKKIKVKLKGNAKRFLSKKGKQKLKTKVKVANKANGAKKTFKLKIKG